MKVQTVLTKDELQTFLIKSDLQGLWKIVFNWGLIALTFAFVAKWPSPLTILLAIILIGGRQVGLGVLMHDSAHDALFKTRSLNRFFGQYLCAYPILSNLPQYREIHLTHHKDVGLETDPDLTNYVRYPVSKESFKRKVIRDLTGQTGIKLLSLTLFKGKDQFTLSNDVQAKRLGPLLFQLLLLAILWATGNPWLYLIWMAAYLTTYMLFLRIRQVAEHAAVPNLKDRDPRQNTRTTIARWWERLTLAPNSVNYHLEHHLLPTVPPHKLQKLHHTLNDRGFYSHTPIANGYVQVIQNVTQKL